MLLCTKIDNNMLMETWFSVSIVGLFLYAIYPPNEKN